MAKVKIADNNIERREGSIKYGALTKSIINKRRYGMSITLDITMETIVT